MIPKKLSQKEFDKIYSKVPRVSVDIVVKTGKGIILTKRSFGPWKGQWHIPGASIRYGESIKDAIERVAKKELNLKVKVIKKLGDIEWLDKFKERGHSISLVFLVKTVSGEIKLDFQATSYNFFKKIPLNTIKEQRKFLKDFLKKRR